MFEVINKIWWWSVILVLSIINGNAQQLNQERQFSQLEKKAGDAIYNLDFASSQKIIAQLQELEPEHPVISLLLAYEIYWKCFPLHPDSPQYFQYKNLIDEGLDKALTQYKKKDTPETTFYVLSAHNFLLKYYDDEKNLLAALREGTRTYPYLKMGLKLKEEYPDFYLYTGLYKFYREQYPESYPSLKPLVWMFKGGSIEEGIYELKKAATLGRIVTTEAKKYLGIIYLQYRNQPDSSIVYFEQLKNSYPNNDYFQMLYTENLLNLEKYEDAKKENKFLSQSSNPYYQLSAGVFSGIYLEKKLKDDRKAETRYKASVEISKQLKAKTNNYLANAYAGLARISERAGNNKEANYYYKMALKYGEYDGVKKEARQFLEK
ncbi:tetratricopeptide repeat protein [Xanthovirga aplysinae]|uniref:tetratricopeptide repeat protein n=1 Tax=Xanthovirga aplysinae TaxID=2529853 RepID=UPI0012BCD729|nr:tetratricopeptide repeat protein [Xanthovirga aplysinae]MTI33464.1 tetratricopeptide repeat protein [Xanthovirga aplysinae]